MPTTDYYRSAFELTSHIYDLCVAHDIAGMHDAMLLGVKLGGMKPGDALNVYGCDVLQSTFCDCPLFDNAGFQLRIVKLDGKGYAAQYVA